MPRRSSTAKRTKRKSFNDDPTPIYHQIRRRLEARMHEGKLPVGAKVPTEFELCEEFSVSRITSRRALDLLRRAGVIERTRGRGSYVIRIPEPPATREGKARASEVGILTSFTNSSLSSPLDDWSLQIMRRVNNLLTAEGFHLNLIPADFAREHAVRYQLQRIDQLGNRLVGVIGFSNLMTGKTVAGLEKRNLPWVSINPLTRSQPHNFVSADNHGGGRLVGSLFAERGLAPVAVLGPSPEKAISSADKYFGFIEGYLQKGGSLEGIRYITSRGIRLDPDEIQQLRRSLEASHFPAGVFCQGDLLGSDLLKVCATVGRKVPDDVSVVGSTGLSIAEHTTPTLSVIPQPMEAMGRAAEEMLLRMIHSGNHRQEGRYIMSELVFRESFPQSKQALRAQPKRGEGEAADPFAEHKAKRKDLASRSGIG